MTTNPKLASLPPPTTLEKLATKSKSLRDLWESWHPTILGVAAFLVALRLPIGKVAFDSILKDIAPAAISVAAIFAGFQGAIHAILLSMLRSRVVRSLRRSGSYGRLISYIRSGILSLTCFVALAMLAMLVNAIGLWTGHWRPAVAILIGMFACSLFASLRIMMIEVSMLQVPEDEGAGAAPDA